MRHVRNIIIGTFLLSFIFGLCLYLSTALFVLLIWGSHAVDFQAINPSLDDFPNRLWPTIFDYIYEWWLHKYEYPVEIHIKLLISVFGPLSILFVVFWTTRRTIVNWRPYKKKESLHGDAKWATEREIKKVGLRSKHGLILGQDRKGFLVAGGFQHALLFAPTGSGKGVGFVIPNLLFWKDSVIVHDIKLENFELTSGWREKLGQEVYCWSPADADGISHCYNPLDWVSAKKGQMVDDVQKIANLLMPEQDFWVNEARSLFLGIVLYILAVPEKIKSFGEVVRTMRSDDVVYNLAVVLDTIGSDIHPVAYMNIAAFLQKAEKERSGVISTMNSSLELWANPLIDTTTATSDFNFMEFKRRKVTVYVGLTPDNLTRLQPLMQVFYQQATEFLCRKLPDKKNDPYGVLFMMDEFPTLGEMEQFKTGIAYFRGYNVRLFLIIQDTEQLKGIYEEAGMNSFLSNSTYRITFAANNVETANLISQLIGNKTVAQESLNKPKFLDLNPASRSLHVSDTQRALLLPQEVIMLPRDEQILLIESTSPIKCRKICYYKESFFIKRLLSATFVPVQEPFDPKKYEEKIKEEKKARKQNLDNAPIENESLKTLLPSADSEEINNEEEGHDANGDTAPQGGENYYEDDDSEAEDVDDINSDNDINKTGGEDSSDSEIEKEEGDDLEDELEDEDIDEYYFDEDDMVEEVDEDEIEGDELIEDSDEDCVEGEGKDENHIDEHVDGLNEEIEDGDVIEEKSDDVGEKEDRDE